MKLHFSLNQAGLTALIERLETKQQRQLHHLDMLKNECIDKPENSKQFSMEVGWNNGYIQGIEDALNLLLQKKPD
jgi:hypothetical protein